MADYASDEHKPEYAEYEAANRAVLEDPDEFEAWEKVVRAAESLEGGLNRNSSPQAIAITRNVFDRFLAKFPLLFGYWKKYADMEFSIAGTEAAEMVYERGIASINNSVDLWANYCSFKVETCHDSDIIRELFERGANAVGLDFLSHPFWDKYIEFEERLECEDKIFAILERVVHIPMHQYSRYFERFRALAQTRPLTELLPEDTLAQFRSEVIASDPPLTSEAEIEREVRTRIDQFHLEIFARTQTETTKRWTYESEIKRPYFHVTELDEPQLVNWRKYLDFEEAEKSGFDRVQFLYERCLVTCALYDEFWYRYARWMYAQPGHEEEVRNIYQRASMVFVPISRLGIRLQYAVFEESTGRPDMARAIYESVIECLPGNIETIIAWANFERRQGGLEAAIAVYRAQIENDRCDIYAKGALTAEWARLLWKVKGNVGEAREVFEKNSHWYLDSRYFWINYLQFELDQPTSAATEKQQYERISKVVDDIRKKSHLPPLTVKDLTHQYMVYLLERGIPFPPTPAASPSAAAAPGTAPSTKPDPTSVAKEYLHLDKEVNGPFSVRRDEKIKLAEDGKETTTERRMMRENGHPGVEVDDQSLARGESPYVKLFQMQGDSVGAAGAQGSVAAQ